MESLYINAVDQTPRSILVLGRDYPDGFQIMPHHHRRGQLMSAVSGLIVLTTPDGTWVMPPQRGMWIPAGVVHSVQAVGLVQMQSLYIEPDDARDMPGNCQVVSITPFMRSLIVEALELPMEYEIDARTEALMALMRLEMARLPVLPLSLPYPRNPKLADKCRAFVHAPDIHETTDDWCNALGMSRRAFTRIFRRETGLSFMAWRQQACLLAALPQLASGRSVTAVAMELGYGNPAAFSIMFKRAFGTPPLSYLGLRSS